MRQKLQITTFQSFEIKLATFAAPYMHHTWSVGILVGAGGCHIVGRHEVFEQRLNLFEQRLGQLAVSAARQVQVVVHIVVADGAVGRDEPLRVHVEEVHVRRHVAYPRRHLGVDRGDLLPQRIVELATRRNSL